MNTNLLIITIAFLPLVVILITYNIFFNKRVGVALRDLNRIFETERAKFVFAFGPRILFVHFTMHFAANKETLLFTIGVILTLLALIYIEESIIFALAMVGSILLEEYLTFNVEEFGLNADTFLMFLGIIFTAIAFYFMKKRPEL